MKLNKEKVFVYVSEQKGYTEGLLGTNKVNFYYRFDNNELFWKSDAEKDKEKWHGTYYDKDKGVTSADKLGEYEANEEKAGGVIKGPLQAYNALRHNPDRIGDLIKEGELLNEMGVKYEEVILPREFFILGPKGWAVSAWPYKPALKSEQMPEKCKKIGKPYCLCVCKSTGSTGKAVEECDKSSVCDAYDKKMVTIDTTIKIGFKEIPIQINQPLPVNIRLTKDIKQVILSKY